MNKTLYDKDIREPLFQFLELEYGKIRFFEEKIIGRSRADVVAVIDGALIGIEIKSDADIYARLKKQARDYDKYFDYNYVAAGTSHARHIHEHVPAHWGIITVEPVEGSVDCYLLRKPVRNEKRDLKRELSLLWKRELEHIRQEHIRYKYAGRSKAFLCEKLIEQIPEEILMRLMSDELFERDYTLL